MAVFSPTWLGGAAETLFRRHHAGVVDGACWDVDPNLTELERERLRLVWTHSAHQEWCAAAAFVALQEALLLARAPVDLIGASGRFVADEMLHVELACRMATAYGGGAPLDVDPTALRPSVAPGRTPRERAGELAVRVSCVGESFSLPLIAAEFAATHDPLSRHVLGRIAKDEAAHSRIGWWVLDWLEERATAAERRLLAVAADDAIDALRPVFVAEPSRQDWMSDVLARRIAAPLAARGIQVAARSWSASAHPSSVSG